MGETTDEMRPTPEEGVGNAGSNAPDGSTAQIRSNIEQTRMEMSGTVEALQQKLDPERIAERVKEEVRGRAAEAYESAKQTAKEATIGKARDIVANVSEKFSDMTSHTGSSVMGSGSSILNYIREHPGPCAFLGIGLAMLVIDRRKQAGRTYRGDSEPWRDEEFGPAGTARPQGSGVADKVRGVMGQARDAMSSAADNIRDKAGSAIDAGRQQWTDVADRARSTGQRATGGVSHFIRENPLAVGVAALAAGAAVGLSLPSTRIEQEYMGDTRDDLVDRAKSFTRETVDKVERVAQEAGQSLKDAAQREGLTTAS